MTTMASTSERVCMREIFQLWHFGLVVICNQLGRVYPSQAAQVS
jgi:hypothetical protein